MGTTPGKRWSPDQRTPSQSNRKTWSSSQCEFERACDSGGIGIGGVKDGETTDIILVYELANGLLVACEVFRRCHDHNGHTRERYREGQTSVGLVSKGNIANCVTAILRFLYHSWGNINRDFEVHSASLTTESASSMCLNKYLAAE